MQGEGPDPYKGETMGTVGYQVAMARERKAREIVATGGVTPGGDGGWYYVDSQAGHDPYQVNVYIGRCACPDNLFRGNYCKHLRAAEIYAARNGTDNGTDNGNGKSNGTPNQVVLEVRGYARGRQFLDKRIERVRTDGGSYRPAANPDFDAALRWLESKGYELANVVGPQRRFGTQLARYTYRQTGGQ